MQTNIIVSLQHEATHNWPSCPIQEVQFLRHPHRHIFFIKIKKVVSHSDRDIEIIQLKHQVQQYLADTYQKDFGSKSCEMLAEELLIAFKCISVEVLEDNENGAEVLV